MNEEWWEGLISFLCDWWWLVLIIMVVIAVIFFTRNLWMPALGFAMGA